MRNLFSRLAMLRLASSLLLIAPLLGNAPGLAGGRESCGLDAASPQRTVVGSLLPDFIAPAAEDETPAAAADSAVAPPGRHRGALLRFVRTVSPAGAGTASAPWLPRHPLLPRPPPAEG